MGVEVLSLSTDSRFSHKIWQAEELEKMVKGGVPYPMLSDAGGRIGRVYGVYDEGSGVDLRGRFIIDPDGVIQAMEDTHSFSGPQCGRIDPAGAGFSAGAEHRRGHPFGMAAR